MSTFTLSPSYVPVSVPQVRRANATSRRPGTAPGRTRAPAARSHRPDVIALRLRQAVAALFVGCVAIVGSRAAAGALGGSTTTSGVRPAATVTQRYVVRPGDTMWAIARHLEPNRDPREVVDVLVSRHGGSVIQPGEVIEWEGL